MAVNYIKIQNSFQNHSVELISMPHVQINNKAEKNVDINKSV